MKTVLMRINLKVPPLPEKAMDTDQVKENEAKKQEAQTVKTLTEPSGDSSVLPKEDRNKSVLNGTEKKATLTENDIPVFEGTVLLEREEETPSVRFMLSGEGLRAEITGRHFIGADERLSDLVFKREQSVYISGRHAQIERIGESLFITDAGSKNGTFVNNRRLEMGQTIKLIPGDVLRLADQKLTIFETGNCP